MNIPYVTKKPMTLEQFEDALAPIGWISTNHLASDKNFPCRSHVTGMDEFQKTNGDTHVIFWVNHTAQIDDLLNAITCLSGNDDGFHDIAEMQPDQADTA